MRSFSFASLNIRRPGRPRKVQLRLSLTGLDQCLNHGRSEKEDNPDSMIFRRRKLCRTDFIAAQTSARMDGA
jgi:hypothetical protein